MYTATLTNLGKTTTAKGDTIEDTIKALSPGSIAGKSILTVSNGKRSVDRVIPHLIAKRAFNTMGMTREAGIKSLSLLFNGI